MLAEGGGAPLGPRCVVKGLVGWMDVDGWMVDRRRSFSSSSSSSS